MIDHAEDSKQEYDHVEIEFHEHSKKDQSTLHRPMFCIIPVAARLNKKISKGAKIFLGELLALSNKYGYCWASDENLAQMHDESLRTTQRWLQELEDEKFIYRNTFSVCDGLTEEKKINFKKKRKIYVFQRPTLVSKKVCEHDKNGGTIEPPKMAGRNNKPLNIEKSISKEIPKEKPEPRGSSRPKPPATDSHSLPKKSKFYEDSKKLSEYHFKKIQEINPNAKKPNLEKWSIEMERILRIDKVPKEEVKEMIDWIFDVSDFWYKIILSPVSLRKQWDKLKIQRKERNKKTSKNLKKQTGKKFEP